MFLQEMLSNLLSNEPEEIKPKEVVPEKPVENPGEVQ